MLKRGIPVLGLGCLLLLGMLSCTHLSYYAQSIRGHLKVISATRPVDELISAPDTPLQVRERLQFVQTLLEFARSELALENQGSYTSYADIGRPYVVWNVVATPSLSLTPQTWCFWFAGCVPYRGYFHEQDAIEFAQDLRRQGLDVAISGVPAYSTLGWFDDPLLNTFLFEHKQRLAGLIFHELAHQTLYVKDASDFNEAFATVVSQQGIQLWTAAQGDPGLVEASHVARARETGFFALFDQTRHQLEEIYASTNPDALKLERKHRVIEGFKSDYRALLESWGGEAGGVWLEEGLNNARFAAASTYRKLVPAFETLWRQCAGNPETFYRAAEKLSQLPVDERQKSLELLAGD